MTSRSKTTAGPARFAASLRRRNTSVGAELAFIDVAEVGVEVVNNSGGAAPRPTLFLAYDPATRRICAMSTESLQHLIFRLTRSNQVRSRFRCGLPASGYCAPRAELKTGHRLKADALLGAGVRLARARATFRNR